MYNPLEQFKILALSNITIFEKDYSITNVTLMLVFVTIIAYFTFKVNYSKRTYLPSLWNHFSEEVYVFVLKLMRQQISNVLALKYFPILLFLFFFILVSNLIGLVPYGFTITSQIAITLQLALSLFIAITIVNIYNNQIDFLNLFLPSGVPKPLMPFLVIIEIVSYFIRPLSLSVRLFANMLAGHTLLNILASFVYLVFKKSALLALIPLLFVVFVMVLEFAIAGIQAYIFCILTSIYLNDVYSASH